MKINPIAVNNYGISRNPNFKAQFIENEISKDLVRSASPEDVKEFQDICLALKNAKRDQYSYMLSGVTSGYGICNEAEVDDKFVDLNYKANPKSFPCFIQSWIIRNENIISGGYEKKNLLKEVTKLLKKVASENNFHPAYNVQELIVKKATYVSKLV